eukprot:jgi/Mesen1/345/ME995491C10710
MYPCVHHHS